MTGIQYKWHIYLELVHKKSLTEEEMRMYEALRADPSINYLIHKEGAER